MIEPRTHANIPRLIAILERRKSTFGESVIEVITKIPTRL
jgi:hypothetical protein